MASNRSSRSKKGRSRSAATNKPHLRKPKAGATRAERREQSRRDREAGGGAAVQGPRSRIRRDGAGGLVLLSLGAWVMALLVAIVPGMLMGRWFTVSYPETLWLYVAIGMLAIAPAVGFVARVRSDVGFWVGQASLVSLGALLAEHILGPSCAGPACAAMGALGAWGLPVSLAVLVVLALAALALGTLMYRFSGAARIGRGRSSLRSLMLALLMLGVIAGLPIFGIALLVDSAVRDEPTLAVQAKEDVRQYCFSLGEPQYELEVRADPVPQAPDWRSYLVRRADEDRPAVGGGPLPTDVVAERDPLPYEAAVAYDLDDERSYLSCRLISPRAGEATEQDVEPIDPTLNNPLLTPVPGGSTPNLLQEPGTPLPAEGEGAGAGTGEGAGDQGGAGG